MELKKVKNPLNDVMKNRSSVRKYDTSVKISRSELSDILQDAMSAPSSFNLQPWRFIVIDSKEGKELIKPYLLFNSVQWETSSAIIAIFGNMQVASTADAIYNSMVDHHLINYETKDKIVKMISDYTKTYTTEKLTNTIMLDCGFVGMQIMLSAKNYGYDTNPIGGYMKKELTQALGLDPTQYLPVVLLSVGKANEAVKDTTRYSVDEITQWR